MFVAQPRQHPAQHAAMQPDFPVSVGHVTGAMEQIKKIPNMPIVAHGAEFLDVLHAIQADLKEAHGTVDGTKLLVHRLGNSLDDTRLTLDKVRLDGEETPRDLNQVKQDVKETRKDITKLQHDLEQQKVYTNEIRKDPTLKLDGEQNKVIMEEIRDTINQIKKDAESIQYE